MRVLIRGGNFHNKGDEAMLRTTVAEIAPLLSVSEFSVILSPGQAEYAFGCGVRPIQKFDGFLRNVFRIVAAWLRGDAPPSIVLRSRTAAWQIAAAGRFDAVLDVSGFGYSDVWGTHAPQTTCVWVDHCRQRRIPYIFLPQAWGPFNNRTIAQYVRRFLSKACLVYSRDTESLTHLRGLFGTEAPKIKLAPDIAFLFRGRGADAGAEIIRRHGLDPTKRPIIGITPNMRVYERSRGVGFENEYLRFLGRTAKLCSSEFEAAIVLIPHEIKLSKPHALDDRYLCSIVETMLRPACICRAITDRFLADEIRSVYEHLDLVIGSRFHSLVFALSAGVPVLAVGWAHKYAELLRSFALERFVVELPQINDEIMKKMLREAWSARAATRHQIQGCLPGIKQQVVGVFQEVVQFINAASKEGHSPGW